MLVYGTWQKQIFEKNTNNSLNLLTIMEHKISIKTSNGVVSVEDFKAQGVNKNDVVGVILQTETIGLIISLDSWKEKWSDGSGVLNKACGEAEALQTLSGLELTRTIVNKTKNQEDTMNAAIRCFEYDNGNLQWYLPCLYELGTIIAYRNEINKVMQLVGGDEFDEDDWGWSGSEGTSTYAWYVYFGNGGFGISGKYYSFVVRAVSAFSPLERGDLSSPSGKGDSYEQLTEESAIALLRSHGYTGELIKKINL